jgi:hypothetical protein
MGACWPEFTRECDRSKSGYLVSLSDGGLTIVMSAVAVGSLKFQVQVPHGGVEEGHRFSVDMPATSTMSGVSQVSIPVGQEGWDNVKPIESKGTRSRLTKKKVFQVGRCSSHRADSRMNMTVFADTMTLEYIIEWVVPAFQDSSKFAVFVRW